MTTPIYATGFKLLRKSLPVLFAFISFVPSFAFAVDVIEADVNTIIESKNNKLTVWRVAGNENIFIFDFPNLTMQGHTFNRATQFNEQQFKGAPYAQVLNNEALQKYMDAVRRTNADFAFGHDLLVSELVQFFNLVDRDKIGIFPEEVVLRDFLLEYGLIKQWRDFYQALKPDVVILSVPQKQERRDFEPKVTALARYTIFSHEMAHAEFYTNKYYSDYCRKFWNNLSDTERSAFINFFKKYNYQIDNAELLVNEMQAYLMFTPDFNSFSASRLGVTEESLESMRQRFRAGKPPTKLKIF